MTILQVIGTGIAFAVLGVYAGGRYLVQKFRNKGAAK